MHAQLPTFTSAQWTVTSLRDSLRHELLSDTRCVTLRLFANAITQPGWQEIRPAVIRWFRGRRQRTVVVYAGTDHALTEPDALRAMSADGLDVRLMRTYHGIYHPKLFWLLGDHTHCVWVGSNNITREGLLHNVEFATLIKTHQIHPDLDQWFQGVHGASEPFGEPLVGSYEAERRAYATRRATVGTFTWSQREEPILPPTRRRAGRRDASQRQRSHTQARGTHLQDRAGELVVEVMPRETGPDGKQIQLPKDAVVRFFGLQNRIGASRQLTLTPTGGTQSRTLTMTLFRNNTARLSITELDYRDRPCVIVFHPLGGSRFQFEIVQQSIFPARYRRLIGLCGNQTRAGSRQWTIL